MPQSLATFDHDFQVLIGHRPMAWQRRLFGEHFLTGDLPAALDLPTGLGKTSVMALWYLAFKAGAPVPRRLVYVVDRRVVVDQATAVAEEMRKAAGAALPISTLRGQHIDNRDWLADPAAPAIVVGTVDMIGSRLLFSGYGVSRKMRPYHAGLLGADALVVLDESHLVPPFEALLESIASGDQLGPRQGGDLVPRFRLLSLSATGRDRPGPVFRLGEADLDAVASQRLGAKKALRLLPLGDGKLEVALADQAWALVDQGNARLRCLVYCDSREVAEKTAEILRKKTSGKAAVELLVGARRSKERVEAKRDLETLGFVAGKPGERACPAILIATSAGEVGIDLDADQLVCDLVPWERMVQRLGRVNRRGAGDARVIVVHPQDARAKKPDDPTAKEVRDMIAFRGLAVLQALPQGEDGFDASPGALRDLKRRAESDAALQAAIDAATTPAPLHPALTRPLVDSWSMTSLAEHTGRPDIQPWLRGWEAEDDPQTVVVWRRHLPVRGTETVPDKEVAAFFEAAAPHASELLETETWRIVEWLAGRATALMPRSGTQGAVTRSDVVAHVLSPSGDVLRHGGLRLETLADLANKNKRRENEALARDLAGAVLVVDARLGGLLRGMLAAAAADPVPTADEDEDWLPLVDGQPVVRFRVRAVAAGQECASDLGWRAAARFITTHDGDGEAIDWLLVEKWRDAAAGEDSRSAGRLQELAEHQAWAEQKARDLARALRLPKDYADVLCLAARLHDEGKRQERWQRAFSAPKSPSGVAYAKTPGPLNQLLLDGYRHELGSLPALAQDTAFQVLPADLQDLALHLVAAHHGEARPVITTRSCDDVPPSVLERRAAEVALRFARLQKRWGPWGLAWWEALLRAADQQASRDNDRPAAVPPVKQAEPV